MPCLCKELDLDPPSVGVVLMYQSFLIGTHVCLIILGGVLDPFAHVCCLHDG